MSSQLSRAHNAGTLVLKPWDGDQPRSSQFDEHRWQNFDNPSNPYGTSAFQDADDLYQGSAGPVNFVLSVWQRLKSHNTICTLASQPSIYAFAEQCIFFATIEFRPLSTLKETELIPDRLKLYNKNAVGCIYLSSTHRTSEASIGIILLPEHTGKGYGPLAIEMALQLAFDTYGFHRVCATIPEHNDNSTAIGVFQRIGFVHEGTHRLAATSEDGSWVDEHHYSMLETDWVFRRTPVGASTGNKEWKMSQWEQLLARQEKEREVMLLKDSKLHRTGSTETLRLLKQDQDDIALCYPGEGEDESEDEDMSDAESFVSLPTEEKGKQSAVVPEASMDPFASSISLPQPPAGDVERSATPGDEGFTKVKLEDDGHITAGTNPFSTPAALSPRASLLSIALATRPPMIVPSGRAATAPPPTNRHPSPSTSRILPLIDLSNSLAAGRNASPRWSEYRRRRSEEFDARSEASSHASRWDLVDDNLSVRSVSERSPSESAVSASEEDFVDLSDDSDDSDDPLAL